MNQVIKVLHSQYLYFGIIQTSLQGTTFGMAHYDYEFGTCYVTRKLHGSQDVLINKVSGNPYAEDISQPLIKDELCRSSGVYTAEYYCKRPLALPGVINLFQQIPVYF